jgi:ferredoxin-NADP reductase
MEEHLVKVRSVQKITRDVLQIVTEKPAGYHFTPGQATSISLNKFGWREATNPFTFTSLPDDDFLEFTIKTYPARKGLTHELLRLENNDSIYVHDVFGAISYQGPGTFIAGGAGITPFISILRFLQSKDQIGENRLIFANKTKDDIILRDEFKTKLGERFINILASEKTEEYAYGHITKEFLLENCPNLKGYFYVCGPPPMMDAVEKQLAEMHIDEKMIVKELF